MGEDTPVPLHGQRRREPAVPHRRRHSPPDARGRSSWKSPSRPPALPARHFSQWRIRSRASRCSSSTATRSSIRISRRWCGTTRRRNWTAAFWSSRPCIRAGPMSSAGWTDWSRRRRKSGPISNQATAGVYYFARELDFQQAAMQMIKKGRARRRPLLHLPCLQRNDPQAAADWGLGNAARGLFFAGDPARGPRL